LNRVTGPGGTHQIEPRIMRVLLVLVERAGGVVTRQELLDEVWADAIVGEEILTRAVSELRHVFGDDPRQPTYIETIRHHGYRLIVAAAPLEADAPPATSAIPLVQPTAPPVTPAARRLARTMVRRAVPLLVMSAVAILTVTAPRWWRGGDDGVPSPLMPAPLTSYPGRELHPALSPDGTRVAFAWSGADGRSPGIHVKQRNSETALRLTAEPGWPAWPVWLADGQTVAFVQTADTVSTICLVPSIGGAVRRLREVRSLVEGLDVSPDGTRLVWAARGADGGPYRLDGLLMADPAALWRPTPPTGAAGDVSPRFAPDGRWLAWVALGPGGDGTILCAPAAGGEPRVVVQAHGAVGGLAWTPDSRRLVYASAPAGMFGLWQVDRENGRAAPLGLGVDFAWNPTIAALTGDLAFEQVQMDQDIWRLRAVAREPWRFETAPYLVSTRREADADLDPASGRVVFVSSRSGSPQIWVAGPDGVNPARLTELAATAVSHPRWSPDGSRVAFRAVTGQGAAVLVMAAAGGPPRAAPLEAADVLLADWSRDGRSLLVAADLGSGWQIHRLDPIDGSRQTLTRRGGLTAAESSAGSALFHTRPGLAGLWRQDLAGADEPVLEIPGLLESDRDAWRLADGGIRWVMRAGGRAVLMHHDLATGRSLPLAELPGFTGGSLAVSRSGDIVLFTRAGEVAGDLMLLENFAATDR
jgi:Tol biopolymer transport system component/DNA-binding winged helix-turn-helix (wHTH) protein